MMAEDPDTMDDYTLRGWRLRDFRTRQKLEHWAYDHVTAAEYEEAKTNLMTHGQTAVLHVRDAGGFLRIDLEPAPGRFWVFVPQHVLDRWERIDWHPHISMTYADHNTQKQEIFERIKPR